MCPTGQLDSFCHTALGRTAYEMNRQETGVNLGIAVPWLQITELGSNVQDGVIVGGPVLSAAELNGASISHGQCLWLSVVKAH